MADFLFLFVFLEWCHTILIPRHMGLDLLSLLLQHCQWLWLQFPLYECTSGAHIFRGAIAHLNNSGMMGPDVKTSQRSGEVRSRHVYCIIIFRWFQITPHAQTDGTGMSTGMGSLQSAACCWKIENISTDLFLWGHFIFEAKSSEPIRHSCTSHLQQYKDNSKT